MQILTLFLTQSWGHNRRQEVDSGRSEEEAFAAVVRPQTTAPASQPSKLCFTGSTISKVVAMYFTDTFWLQSILYASSVLTRPRPCGIPARKTKMAH